jgi:multiple sugar transport system substrate-binding protein
MLAIGLILSACGAPTAAPAASEPTAAPAASEPTAAPAASEPTAAPAMSEPVKVSVWFHSGQGGERDALNAQVADFNASQSQYVIEAVQLPEGSYNDQVNAAALANGLPCLLDFDGPNLYNYAWKGYLRPIDDFVSPELKADFLPSIIAQGTYAGKLYSLGAFDSGLALWGNRALLEQAGVRIPTSASEPWTLQEFEGALKALKDSGVEYPIDMKVNYGNGWWVYSILPLIESFGGDLIDRSSYAKSGGTLDGAATVKAMETFQSWATAGYFNPAQTTDDDFYGSKKSALAWVGHWMYTTHKEALGDDLVLIPMPKFGETAMTGMGSWNWGITSSCATPEGAWAFLEYLVSPEQIIRMTDANGAIPARTSALALKQDVYGEGGPLKIYVDQLNTIASPRPVTPAFATIATQFGTAVSAILNGGGVQDELTKAASAIDQDIEDNNGYQTP